MLATGIKHVFLTASRVLADDLRFFYNKLLKAVKNKLAKKGEFIEVEEVLEMVTTIQTNPEEILNDEEEDEFADLGDIDSLKKQVSQMSYGDSENLMNNTAFGNKEIVSLKKKTLEEIEQRLKEYNFRFDNIDNSSTDYPKFTTVLDFYQEEEFKKDYKRSFFFKSKFRFDYLTDQEEKSLSLHNFFISRGKQKQLKKLKNKNFKNLGAYQKLKQTGLKTVSFREYLDHYSNKKFGRLNSSIAKQLKKSGIVYNKDEGGGNGKRNGYYDLSNYNFRLIDGKGFKEEFLPYFELLCKEMAREAKNAKKNGWECFIPEKKIQWKIHHLEWLEKGFPNNFRDFEKFVFLKEKFSPGFLWNIVKNSWFKKYKGTISPYELSEEELKGVQFLYQVYENWKEIVHGYDLSDLVDSHSAAVSKEIFDFVYLDEIQDVSLKVILDLDNVTEYGFVGFGDNAQNISKGISMKFNFLFDILKKNTENRIRKENGITGYVKTTSQFVQLTKNFRSQARILDLGNSIVKILELLQRGDMDVMADETSELSHHKPILMSQDTKITDLVDFVNKAYGSTIQENGRIEGRADQVILVRDEEEKRNLPDEFKDMICFTINESKGLEFEHVLLYNFFSASQHYQSWKYLRNIEIEFKEMKEADFQNLKNDEKWENNGKRSFRAEYDAEKELYSVPLLSTTTNLKHQDKEMYEHINDELKALYVAITRAKTSFVVFDHGKKSKNREVMDSIWKKLNTVEIIKAGDIEMTEGLYHQEDEDKVAQWLYKGFEFLRREQFKNAKKCFTFLGHKKAIQLADSLILLEEIQQKEYFYSLNQNSQRELIEEKLKEDYQRLGDMFREIEKFKDAALCYFNAQNFVKALENFEKVGDKVKIAQMNYLLEDYTKASEVYKEIEDYYHCLICLQLGNKLEELFDVLMKLVEQKADKMNKVDFQRVFGSSVRAYFTGLNTEYSEGVKETQIEEFESENEQEVEEIEEKEGDEEEDEFEKIDEEEELEKSAVSSFQILKDSFDNASDRLSDSFINLTFDNNGKAFSSGESAFVELGYQPKTTLFIEDRVISRLLKFFSCFSTEIKKMIKTQKVSNSISEKKTAIDGHEFEIDNSMILMIIDHLIDWDLLELALMIIYRYSVLHKLKTVIMRQAEKFSFLARQNVVFDYHKIYSEEGVISANDQRRLTTAALFALFNKIPKEFLSLKSENNPKGILELQDLQLMTMLGFVRQILFVLPYKKQKEYLSFFGDIESLGVLHLKHDFKEIEGVTKDEVIQGLSSMSSLKKIEFVAKFNIRDLDLIDCAFFRLFISSFWELFEENSGKEAEIEEFVLNSTTKAFFPKFVKLVKCLQLFKNEALVDSNDQTKLFGMINRLIKNSLDVLNTINNSQKPIKIYEAGIVLGVLYSLIKLNQPTNNPFEFKKGYQPFRLLFGGANSRILKNRLKTSNLTLLSKLDQFYNTYLKISHTDNKEMSPSLEIFMRGFWTTWLIKRVKPRQYRLFDGFGIDYYFAIHKLSFVIQQIRWIAEKSLLATIVYFDSSLEMIGLKWEVFEKCVLVKVKEKENRYVFSRDEMKRLRRGDEDESSESELSSEEEEGTMIEIEQIPKMRKEENKRFVYKGFGNHKLFERCYTDINQIEIKNQKLLQNLLSKETNENAIWIKKQNMKKITKEKIEEIKSSIRSSQKKLDFKHYTTYREQMKIIYNFFILNQNLKKGDFEDLLIDYLNKPKKYTAEDIIDIFFLTEKLGKLEWFIFFFREYKKNSKFLNLNNKKKEKEEGLNDLFFNLIDSEVSLRAGCVNEFIYGQIFILDTYFKRMRYECILSICNRLAAIYAVSVRKSKSIVLTKSMKNYFCGQGFRQGNLVKDDDSESDFDFQLGNCKFDAIRDFDEVTNLICKQLLTLDNHFYRYKIDKPDFRELFKFVKLNSNINFEELTNSHYLVENLNFEKKFEDENFDLYTKIQNELTVKRANIQYALNAFRRHSNIFVKKLLKRETKWKTMNKEEIKKEVRIIPKKTVKTSKNQVKVTFPTTYSLDNPPNFLTHFHTKKFNYPSKFKEKFLREFSKLRDQYIWKFYRVSSKIFLNLKKKIELQRKKHHSISEVISNPERTSNPINP